MNNSSIKPQIPRKVAKGERPSASHIDSIIDALAGGMKLNAVGIPYGLPWHLLSFWPSQLSENSVRVSAGNVNFHAKTTVAVAETDVTLTGSPCYVYVEIDRAALTGTIEAASTKTASTVDKLRLHLCEYTPTDGIYSLSAGYHIGDWDFDLPIMP